MTWQKIYFLHILNSKRCVIIFILLSNLEVIRCSNEWIESIHLLTLKLNSITYENEILYLEFQQILSSDSHEKLKRNSWLQQRQWKNVNLILHILLATHQEMVQSRMKNTKMISLPSKKPEGGIFLIHFSENQCKNDQNSWSVERKAYSYLQNERMTSLLEERETLKRYIYQLYEISIYEILFL